MNFVALVNDWLLGFFFFGVIFCGICLTYTSLKTRMSSSLALSCLLEDAPVIALKGQAYPLATPLITPLSCLLEDAPSYALRGQAYLLATPLACLWKQGWLSFYRQKLAQREMDYWQWKDKPFADQINTELSMLLQLSEPQASVKEALQFWAREKKAIWSPESLSAFQCWHHRASQQMERESLQSIYSVCYGICWQDLQLLLSELNPALLKKSAAWWQVLEVKSFARPSQVEQAYKKLIRLWHPDLNPHPLATQVTARLNEAYEYYQKYHPLSQLKCSSPLKTQTEVLISIKKWVKSKFFWERD